MCERIHCSHLESWVFTLPFTVCSRNSFRSTRNCHFICQFIGALCYKNIRTHGKATEYNVQFFRTLWWWWRCFCDDEMVTVLCDEDDGDDDNENGACYNYAWTNTYSNRQNGKPGTQAIDLLNEQTHIKCVCCSITYIIYYWQLGFPTALKIKWRKVPYLWVWVCVSITISNP